MNEEIKAAKKTLARTKFVLWLKGYRAGRKTGNAEGWMDYQRALWLREAKRHDRSGRFTRKKQISD